MRPPLAQADADAKKAVAVEIYTRFHAMKTWGKEPESLDGITQTMMRDLSAYSAEKILKAFSTHAQRSQDFPTTFDLVNLIKRNGRPPLRESDVIAIRRKDGEDRSPGEWQMLREWDDQQFEAWDDEPCPFKQENFLKENVQLRQALKDAQAEISRLGNLVSQLKREPIKHEESYEAKVQRTIEFMKKTGCSEADITEFVLNG